MHCLKLGVEGQYCQSANPTFQQNPLTISGEQDGPELVCNADDRIMSTDYM